MSRVRMPFVALVLVLSPLPFGCGSPVAEPGPSTPVTIVVPGTWPTGLDDLHTAADASAFAVRVPSTSSVEVASAPPVWDPVAYVNGLPFSVQETGPVREAYRIVASYRGWDRATIDRWETFIVDDVTYGEAASCWNLMGGASIVGIGHGCELNVNAYGVPMQGTHSDAGFFQLIGLWYSYPAGVLCESEGICSARDIIAMPWSSMNAGLAAIEIDGKGPWCYNADARRIHWSCATTPRYWP